MSTFAHGIVTSPLSLTTVCRRCVLSYVVLCMWSGSRQSNSADAPARALPTALHVVREIRHHKEEQLLLGKGAVEHVLRTLAIFGGLSSISSSLLAVLSSDADAADLALAEEQLRLQLGRSGSVAHDELSAAGLAQLRRAESDPEAARQARHPGQLHADVQLQMMRGVHRATAEDPDDVPLERQESTADKMIQTVAEYQRKQQAHRDATLAQDNAAEEKMNRAVAEYKRKQQAQRNARLAKDNAAMAREKAAVADYTSKHRLTKAKKTAKAAGAHKQDASVAAAAQRKEHRKNTKAKGAEAATPMMAGGAGEKVKIDFYMESMCPGCKYYTKAVLRDLLTKPEFVSMVDFKVVPYGNGRMTGESIQCQHGDDECKGNTILACMQDMYPLSAESTGFVPTFVCMEAENGKPLDDFKKCAKQSEGVVDAAAVLSCANGPKGKQLALAAAKETEELNPPHEYAPWVTMNGQPLRDDAYELQKQVCAAYKAGVAGTSGLCSPAALTTASKRDRAMLHAQAGASFSKCPNDAPSIKYYY